MSKTRWKTAARVMPGRRGRALDSNKCIAAAGTEFLLGARCGNSIDAGWTRHDCWPRSDLPLSWTNAVETMTHTLLVIDDNDSVRDSLRFLLARRGYTVLVADNGPLGIALAAQHA